MGNIDRWEAERQEVFAWARRADVPLWNPPRVPEAAQAMSDEVVRLRGELAGAVEERDELRNMLIRVLDAVALLDHPQEQE